MSNSLMNKLSANIRESVGANRSPDIGVTSSLRGGEGVVRIRNAAEIEVDRIIPDPEQPRKEIDDDALARLASSLKSKGQIQPIVVRQMKEPGMYMIQSGERRWRAAKLAGLRTISAIVKNDDLPRLEILQLQVVENLMREDLKPIEQAMCYRELMTLGGWNVVRLAEELNLAQSAVSRALALLELPEEVQFSVEYGELPPTVAYEISKVEDPEEQAEIAATVIKGKLNRNDTVKMVKDAASRSNPRKTAGPKIAKVKVFRHEGVKVTFECRKGLDTDTLLAALEGIAEQIRGRGVPREGTA